MENENVKLPIIESLSIKGVANLPETTFTFQPGLNIITGRNGSGKTTLLKLIWYIFRNGEKSKSLIAEAVVLKSKKEQLFIELLNNAYDSRAIINWDIDDESNAFFDENTEPVLGHYFQETITVTSKGIKQNIKSLDTLVQNLSNLSEAYYINEDNIPLMKQSFFFSTFRLIEGNIGSRSFEYNELENVIKNFSTSLSDTAGSFVMSANLVSVKENILGLYSKLQTANNRHKIKTFRELEENKNNPDKISELLAEAKNDENERMKSFTYLSESVDLFFTEKSVLVEQGKDKNKEDDVILGTHSNKISMFQLSSGEKQMLQMLVYMCLNEKTVFFIDEPELSMSMDWQRLFVRFMEKNAEMNHNQFFLATHSPAIYRNYPDNEIFLDAYREEEKA